MKVNNFHIETNKEKGVFLVDIDITIFCKH